MTQSTRWIALVIRLPLCIHFVRTDAMSTALFALLEDWQRERYALLVDGACASRCIATECEVDEDGTLKTPWVRCGAIGALDPQGWPLCLEHYNLLWTCPACGELSGGDGMLCAPCLRRLQEERTA